MTDVDPRVAKALKLFLVEDTTLTSFPKIEELKEAMRRYGEADEAFRACDKLGYGNAGRRNWSQLFEARRDAEITLQLTHWSLRMGEISPDGTGVAIVERTTDEENSVVPVTLSLTPSSGDWVFVGTRTQHDFEGLRWWKSTETYTVTSKGGVLSYKESTKALSY